VSARTVAPVPNHVLVVAKAPRPGLVKTRLQPTFSPLHSARLAEAALRDTLDSVRASSADRRILALDGPTGPWTGTGFDVVAQSHGSLNVRLAAAWRSAGGPGIQIGMDTPQVEPALLDAGLDALEARGTDAVLGLAVDGGWWAIGLREPVEGVFDGVPMSRADTGRRQLDRLRALGLRVTLLPALRDVDRPDDVRWLCRAHPHLLTAGVARSVVTGS
jgi:glycosyltransferase A (GT-A) superfamily protein (DUF2064 family)